MAERGSSSGSRADEAEQLLDELLALPDEERERRVEALERERPRLAAELRALEQDYARARRALDGLRESGPGRGDSAAPDDGPARPDPASGYEDRGLVGRGGMGEVRAVWDRRLERQLALKRLLDPPRSGSPRSRRRRERFLEEARIAGKLQHPGIVPVHALGVEEDGRPYYTMPLVQGEDLGAVLERVHRGDEDWLLTRALGVLVRVCDAMAYAHSRGVVHRDLKPANVMVGPFGEVWVMDWGLAKVLGGADTKDIRPREPDRAGEAGAEPSEHELRTMDGDVIGTPGYMSPEQAEGRGEDVGVLSDVYSVGCMLYHLLAGISPYADSRGRSRSAFEVLRLVRAGPPAPVRELAPQTSPELMAICERAMARATSARYQGMGELARDLRAWREDHVVRAYETGSWAELRKWLKRNRALAAASAGALLAVVAGSTGIAWVQTRAGNRLRATNVRLDEARGMAEQRLSSLQRSHYFNNVALAQNALESFNTANLRALLAECPPRLRGWEWRYLERASDASALTLRGHAGDVVAVAFTPDNRRLVSASRDLSMRVWDVQRGVELAVLCGHDDLVDDVSVSPDGRLVASAARDGLVRLWSIDGGAALGTLARHPGPVTSVDFSPDGSRLVSGDQTGVVLMWDVATHRLERELRGHDSNAYTAAFSPDGSLVAAGAVDGSILLWETADGSLTRVLREPGGPFVREVAFSPDGARLAAATIGKVIEVIDVASGRTLQQCVSSTGSVPLAYSPDGLELYAAEFGAVQSWDAVAGRRGPAWLGHAGAIFALDVAPDGRWIASGGADDTVRLWDALLDPACALIETSEENVHALAFSPRSTELAWSGREGRIVVVDPADGSARASWDAGQGWVLALSYHPSLDLLASGGADGSIRLWDPLTGEPQGRLVGHAGLVRTLAFDREGRLSSAGEDGTARVWDVVLRAETARVDCSQALLSADLDPAGARLATCGWEGILRVHDLAAGEVALELEAHPGFAAVAAFDPLGRRIVTGGGDCMVRVWDARDGSLLLEAAGHESSVTRVSFSDDGMRIYSCGWDGLFKIWDAGTGRPALTLSGGEHPLRALAVDADGIRIAAAGLGRRVRVWSAARP